MTRTLPAVIALLALTACPGPAAKLDAAFTVTPSTGDAPLTVTADASASSVPGGATPAYAWSWGDGATGTGRVATHAFTTPGTYAVRLTLTAGGASAEATRTVTVTGTPPTNALSVEPDVIVNDAHATRFTWMDSRLEPRSAALVHNDAPDAHGTRGGYLDRYEYRLPGGATRTVNGTPDAAGGFGMIVSHLHDPNVANGNDDSPLGSAFGGAYRVAFSGAYHAALEFTLNYPRWGVNPATQQNTRYDVPVTIWWVFATGRDHPVYAVTYDLSAAPANAIDADSRAPYGDLRFDGASDGGDTIGGIAWGESYKFTTLGGPLTLNSDWDWSAPNAIAPYHLMWTQNTDAELGLSGTRVIARQDAGGYSGGNGRGKTSASVADRCADPAYRMPCDWKWAYQSVNYSFYDGNGQLATNTPTDSKRFAWGTDMGYLGQQSFVSVNGNAVTGWPRVSYSVLVVMDAHSRNPTVHAAEQVAVADGTAIAATGASVVTSGPAGVNRADTIAYEPAGYDPVFATWNVRATAPTVSVAFTVPAAKTLEHPVIVVHDYAALTAPGTVRLGATTLKAGEDYFASVLPERGELWLTVARDLSGSSTVTMEP